MSTRYWVIVASKNHVMNGARWGIAQANHGKAAPLKRMQVGDGVLYYSPKVEFEGDEKLQAFTAVAYVTGESVYQFDMGGGFVPYRRDVAYLDCVDAPIRPLIPALTFIEDKSRWGYLFRYGFFEIPKADFELIASQMLVEKRDA
ncbi:MAG: EVE domain-containing protein [Ardenticatenaceae bacterium]|nr:EVE domain-containing protein [Anaerolineales bacterium]MCB8922263.1 EVE domain-containing protein [Ardenticatenaceae bacterium]MCB8990552.1 EVE domain-containing protein [Ardenticatenaceae bacterium]